MRHVFRFILVCSFAPVWAADEGGTDGMKYHPGYNPAVEQRHGIGVLPEERWGPEVKGLRAALALPKTIKFNELVPAWFVVRNTSDKVIRVGFPEQTGGLVLQFKPVKHISYGGTEGLGGRRQPIKRWALQPGHQTVFLCRYVHIVKPGDLYYRHGLEWEEPGEFTAVASTTAEDAEEFLEEGGKKPVPSSVSEWNGRLKTGTAEFELIAEMAQHEIIPPPDFPPDHGLTPTLLPPPGIEIDHAERVEFRIGLWLYLGTHGDAHLLADHHRYSRNIYWGPLSAADLERLGFLAAVEKSSRDLLEGRRDGQLRRRIQSLVAHERSLAAIGLDLVPLIKNTKDHRPVPDRVARSIRDRRVKLIAMGLEPEMRAALEHLTADDPPLPDESEFIVVANRDLPPGLKDEAWGPQNDGLQAAALIPDTLRDGESARVPLFIRNTSAHDIFLTVSNNPGYDYATARDADGEALMVDRPTIYQSAIISMVRREYNPGQTRQSPPLATLTKLRLKPGAVYELETRTALKVSIDKPGKGDEMVGFGLPLPEGKPAVNAIVSPPTEATVTWRLHTANGAEYTKDLSRRLWPAKGGWSGLLDTAPVQVVLQR